MTVLCPLRAVGWPLAVSDAVRQRVEGDAGVLRHLNLDGEVSVRGQAQRAELAPAEPHNICERRRRLRNWQRRAGVR